MPFQTKTPIDWSIKNLDTGEVLKPQFPMPEDGVTYPISGNIPEQNRFGEQEPVINWTGGRSRSFTFSAVLFARSADESLEVESLLWQLEGLPIKVAKLGRSYICLFTYGDFLSENVLVESLEVNIVSVDTTRSKAILGGKATPGTLREVWLGFAMKRYEPFSQTQIDPTKPAKESYFLVVSEAERSYEAIARHYYGDPMLGDRLRKRNPQSPFAPDLGEVIHIPPRAIILKEDVEPAFHALSLTNTEALENYERILADRTSRKVVEVK